MSESLKIAGELLWPQLMSNGAYSRPRCRDHTSLPVMSSDTSLPGAEPRVDAAPVGDRARRREVVLVVHFGELSFGRQLVFPQLAAIDAIQRGDEERDLSRDRRGASAERALSGFRWVSALHERRMIARAPRAAPDLRCHEHLIAPHDRRRNSQAAHRRFPRDVLGVAPSLGQCLFPRDAGGRGPSPMRPVLGVGEGARQQQEYQQNAAAHIRHRADIIDHPSQEPQGRLRKLGVFRWHDGCGRTRLTHAASFSSLPRSRHPDDGSTRRCQ